MSEAKRFFRIYGLVCLLYVFFYAIARFFTVVLFSSGWRFGILEWGFVGLIIVIFLHFFCNHSNSKINYICWQVDIR